MDPKNIITNTYNMSLKDFAKENGIDEEALKNLLLGRTTGSRKGSKAEKVKKVLLSKGLLQINTKSSIKVNFENVKETLKYYFISELNIYDIINNGTVFTELDKIIRKKVPSILDLYFNKNVTDYVENIYFKDKSISRADFNQYTNGVGTGEKESSKAYYIKQKLIEDGIMPILLKA